MIKNFVNNKLKQLGRDFGLEIRRLKKTIGVMEGFLRHLKAVGFKPKCILDVGGNKAEWGEEARRFFPDAKFILIEPQIELEPHLKAFCAKSPGSMYKLAGAGREPGEMQLIVWSDPARSSMLFRPEKDTPRELRPVPIITIDSLFENA